MIARRLIISGRVQGVFFRDSTKRKADELGLYGWVRNRDDGSVEIHAEGSATALKPFEVWCHRGSKDALVESITIRDCAPEGYTAFTIPSL